MQSGCTTSSSISDDSHFPLSCVQTKQTEANERSIACVSLIFWSGQRQIRVQMSNERTNGFAVYGQAIERRQICSQTCVAVCAIRNKRPIRLPSCAARSEQTFSVWTGTSVMTNIYNLLLVWTTHQTEWTFVASVLQKFWQISRIWNLTIDVHSISVRRRV